MISGHQLNVFDRQSEIEVGARRNLSEGRYDFLQPFQGTVVGNRSPAFIFAHF